jgi:hypothetical protein
MERGGGMGVGVNRKERTSGEKGWGLVLGIGKILTEWNVEIRNLSSSLKQPIYRDRPTTNNYQ